MATKQDAYKPEGIFHLTGEPDSGKTTAALTAYHPKNTAYIFDDIKKPPIEAKQFGFYLDLVSKYSDLKMLEFYKAMMEEIDKLPQMDSIIFDTWARTGKATRYYAKANPYEFREQSTFAPSGTIANMEKWSEAHRVESDVISKLSQKCKALFLITHIKPKTVGGHKTGTYEPDCGKSFDNVCNMRLWLRHNPNSGVPIALVLKRIAKIELTDKGIQPVNVLPRRVVPKPEYYSVWDSINYYWQYPVGNREPEPDEIPSPFELSILDGVLTDDQKEMWRAELEAERQREKEENELVFGQLEEAKKLTLELAQEFNGMPAPMVIPQIIGKVQEQYPNVTEKDLSEMLKRA